MDLIADTPKLGSPMRLYEENYSFLMQLAPLLGPSSRARTLVSDAVGGMTLCLEINEATRYTSTVTLTHLFNIQGELVPDPHMRVRLYHDAKVAEVLSYQHKPRYWSLYPFPSPWLAYLGEKRNVNRFLREWLQHCLGQGYLMNAVASVK